MTYNQYEISVEDGRPVELFKFVLNGTTYGYTSAEDLQTINSIIYSPIAIARGKIDQTRETRSNIVEITVPATNPIVQAYIATIPGQRTSLTILRYQRSDGATPQVVTLFAGFIHSVSFGDFMRTATISILPASACLSRQIPRFAYQAQCNHVLYDARCKLDENAFKLTAAVSAVSGATITVPGANAHPNGYYNSGRVDFPATGDSRLILDHVGNVLTLLLPFAQNPLGASVNAFAGCAHDGAACFSFNNTVNYGGFPFVPKINPFETGLS